MKTARVGLLLALLASGLGADAADTTSRWSGTLTSREELKQTGSRANKPYEVTEVQEARCVVEPERPSEARCTASITASTKETCPNGRDCSGSVAGSGESVARVYIGVENGKLIINLDTLSIPVRTSSALLGPGAEELKGTLGNWRIEDPAPDNATSLSGNKVIEIVKTDDMSRILTVTWDLSRRGGKKPKPPAAQPGDSEEVEVSVDPGSGYEDWVPEANYQQPDQPGNQMSVRARAHKAGAPGTPTKKKVWLEFSIPSTSHQKGVCMNWPANASEGDGIRLLQRGNESLQVTEPGKARTRSAVSEATLVVSSFDYAAWGTVQVAATDEGGKKVKVLVRGKEMDNPELGIPLDENGNHIADGWEESEGVLGLSATWDDSEVEGQTARGDGLVLYQEYRGVVVQGASGKLYIRLKPREKTHFVIDPFGVFQFDRWKASTGIRAYKLTADMVTSERKVDLYCGEACGNGKYAVRVETMQGTTDPTDPTLNQEDNLAGQFAKSEGTPGKPVWTPKDVDFCRLYPDRVGAMIDRVLEKMKRALTNPTTQADREEAQRLAQLGQQTGLTSADMLRIIDNFDAAARKDRIDRMVALLAIHEMGHACSVNGHLNAAGEEDDVNIRNPSCPSQYLDQLGRRRFVLLGELGGGGTFCKVPPDRCWSHLNVKD